MRPRHFHGIPCRSVELYKRLNFISEGTYGVVYRARDDSHNIYAIKQIKLAHADKSGFPVTALREASILLSLDHPNIVKAKEVVIGKTTDAFYLVMDYAGQDLCSLLERLQRPYAPAEVKSLLKMILNGTAYLHDNWVIHRDLKPSNLLVNAEGALKICDFGLARRYGDPLGKHTPGVVTLWYRAPELFMGDVEYTTSVDMWSVGCIFAELITGQPLFTGNGELEQLCKIANVLGKPSEERWEGYNDLPNAKHLAFRGCAKRSVLRERMLREGRAATSDSALRLLAGFLEYDPKKRLSAQEALQHEYFKEVPRPKEPRLIQTLPENWALKRRLE